MEISHKAGHFTTNPTIFKQSVLITQTIYHLPTRKSTPFLNYSGFSGSFTSEIQPRLIIPKTTHKSPNTLPLKINAAPAHAMAGVKIFTTAAVTRIQYLSLFILTILPRSGRQASPLTFLHFFLVVLSSSGIVYPRSADSQGRGPSPTQIPLTITYTYAVLIRTIQPYQTTHQDAPIDRLCAMKEAGKSPSQPQCSRCRTPIFDIVDFVEPLKTTKKILISYH